MPSRTPTTNRIPFSPVLVGEQTLDEIILNDWSWYTENGIHLHAGFATVWTRWTARAAWCMPTDATGAGAHRARNTTVPILAECGNLRFIIRQGLPLRATGSMAVLAHRDIAAHRHMTGCWPPTHKHAVVIGGGRVGLEAANGLAKRGTQVTVVARQRMADGAPARQRGRQDAAEVAG